ncbi:MAG: hypothetical protein IJH79_18845 [Lentisphaeria bacterium]|nr:hypothetical protein [Lentisphaeria bacterium]
MSPEDLTRLSTKEFSAILAADPVLAELRSRLVDRRDFIPGTFDALLLSGGDRIGDLPVLPLTAAKWAFLWVIESPFVSGKGQVTETDLDLFLFVLSCPDLQKRHVPLSQLPAEAARYAAATRLPPKQILQEIRLVINAAFSPLAMLPSSGGDPEEVFYDGAWLAWIASIAVKESGMPYDRVIHLPLSLLCQLYVAWRRREGIDGDKIRRPQNSKILDLINTRVEKLGKEFLSKKV